MCENLPYESVYFKELHNEQECYWPTIYRAGASCSVNYYYTSYILTDGVPTEAVEDTDLVGEGEKVEGSV